MGGRLTIWSSGDVSSLSGHSWIEYETAGQSTTFGTWGNNPFGLGNGLHKDLELGRAGEVSRTADLDDDQEARLFAVIAVYEAKGPRAWSHFRPCSAFAADAWRAATGERLRHRSLFLVSSPSTLKASILSR